MSFRNLTAVGDWTFGSGRNNYVKDDQEIALNLRTRVLSFLGDCFFAVNEGIDWWNLLDYRYQNRLELQVQEVIKNTPGVVKINSVEVLTGANRKIIINYDIQTYFSLSYQESIIPINIAS